MLTSKYIIVCDDVRREDNGKFMIIGAYMPDMVVQMIPCPLPTLAFFLNLESDRAGQFGFRIKVQHQENGAVLAQAMGIIPVLNPMAPVIMPVKIGGIVLNSPGLYGFSMEVDDQQDVIATTFNVQLATNLGIQHPPGMIPGMPR